MPQALPGPQEIPQWASEGQWWESQQIIPVGEKFLPRLLETLPDQRERRMGGRRSRTRTQLKRGRYVWAEASPGDARDLALDATLRAAAPYQRERRAGATHGPALRLRPQDYQRKVRIRRAANLVLFVVDASWSMAVSERMQATKGAILSLLTDAYQRRDRVGLIVFRGDRATLVLPPTNSVELAQRYLANLPVGGKTPLSAGLWLALKTVQEEKIRRPDLRPLLVILTDGAGNVSMSEQPPKEEAYAIADEIQAQHIDAVVIDMESWEFNQGYARALAERLGGPCYTLANLRADTLLDTVRGELLARVLK